MRFIELYDSCPNFLQYFLFIVFHSGTWTIAVASEIVCAVIAQVLV